MKQLLKAIAIRALSPGKVFPSTATDRQAVQSLINKLHPISPEQGLIRLGPKGDGGYLVPDDLAGIEACFSPGVSAVSGFEKDCADLGMSVFLADKSVAGPSIDHERFHFMRKYVGALNNDDFIKMEDWVGAVLPGSSAELMLQMDIEGFEYETFLNMPDSLMRRFRIMVIELHWLDQLWGWSFFQLASRSLEKILQTHTCVHIHPNNCGILLNNDGVPIPATLEITFLRSDRLSDRRYAHRFPHPLDVDNTSAPTIVLPSNWYRSASEVVAP
ncbi:MAG: hypothetical protein AAFP20_09230 [Cyanobacteria bacterium J06614_10]